MRPEEWARLIHDGECPQGMILVQDVRSFYMVLQYNGILYCRAEMKESHPNDFTSLILIWVLFPPNSKWRGKIQAWWMDASSQVYIWKWFIFENANKLVYIWLVYSWKCKQASCKTCQVADVHRLLTPSHLLLAGPWRDFLLELPVKQRLKPQTLCSANCIVVTQTDKMVKTRTLSSAWE